MAHGRNSMAVAVAAGAAGGMAEVIWIAIAAIVFGLDSSAIVRGITASVAPSVAASSAAAGFGLAIHFILSFAVALVFAQTVARHLHGVALFFAALASLAAIWVFNFFVLLPVINPEFVTLMPHPVSLISKMLFGVAMASVLVYSRGRRRV